MIRYMPLQICTCQEPAKTFCYSVVSKLNYPSSMLLRIKRALSKLTARDKFRCWRCRGSLEHGRLFRILRIKLSIE